MRLFRGLRAGSPTTAADSFSRRRLLGGVALIGGVGALPGVARALTYEEDPGVSLEESYRLACGHPEYHREMVNEVMAILEAEGVSAEESVVREALAAVSCPLCSCTLDQVT